MSKKTLPSPYPTVHKRKRPRTPEHFPKMKYRARNRHHRKRMAQIGTAFITINAEFQSIRVAYMKRWRERLRQIIAEAEVIYGHTAPSEPAGARATHVIYDEAFPVKPANEYTLDPLQVNRTNPQYRRTIVLNPNVRKRH